MGVYKRTFEQPSPQPGVHWSKDVRMDKIAEGFGCHGEYVEKDEEIGPAIARARAASQDDASQDHAETRIAVPADHFRRALARRSMSNPRAPSPKP